MMAAHPTRFRRGLASLFLLLPLLSPPADGQAPDTEAFFELKVRPVLAGVCFKCHGGAKVSAGLRVDSRAALLKGGSTGPAVVPGDPDGSLLLQAVRHTHDSLRMPPNDKLPDATAAALAAWVRKGAQWPDSARTSAFAARAHWSF